MAIKLPTKPSDQIESSPSWPPPQGKWTYEDYARLPEEDIRYEVIEGNLYMSPAPRPKHQMVITKLIYLFYQFVTEQKLGQIYHAPIDVNLPDLSSPVQPDLLFIANDKLDIIKEKMIEGVPDLIIEVLSPGNPTHDRHIKFHIYARAGVSEYWIIDPDTCMVDVFVLRGQAYAPLGTFGPDEMIRSELLPKLTVPVNNICTTM